MFERVVQALRKAALVIFRNLWLFLFATIYALLGPLLVLGGTGLPVLLWWVAGRPLHPALLATDPLAFLLRHWQLILYALLGGMLGYALYLVITIFYRGALTGTVARAVQTGRDGSETRRLPAATFLREGRDNFAGSLGTATLAYLLPLPVLLPLLGLLTLGALRLPKLLSTAFLAGGLPELTAPLIILAAAGVLLLLLTVLLTALAGLWYRYALAALCAEGLPASRAMGAALEFFRRRWRLVLILMLFWLVLGLAFGAASWPFGFLVDQLSGLARGIVRGFLLLIAPATVALGFFLELWMSTAMVVLYLDNRP